MSELLRNIDARTRLCGDQQARDPAVPTLGTDPRTGRRETFRDQCVQSPRGDAHAADHHRARNALVGGGHGQPAGVLVPVVDLAKPTSGVRIDTPGRS